jgi:hypothetical protein
VAQQQKEQYQDIKRAVMLLNANAIPSDLHDEIASSTDTSALAEMAQTLVLVYTTNRYLSTNKIVCAAAIGGDARSSGELTHSACHLIRITYHIKCALCESHRRAKSTINRLYWRLL